jgi:quercetin dioxygenase-like cupin family protein
MTTPYVEPTGSERAGAMLFRMHASPWEKFMKSEGVPIFKGVGVQDCRDLPREPWGRMGGSGTYIELLGLQNRTSMHVIEIPPGGSLNPEKHMYEERYLVLDGRGSTETWTDSSPTPQAFEWAQYSCFATPLNTWHRLVNATSRPAILLAATSAPLAFNMYDDPDFIFNSSHEFKNRYQGGEDYFKPKEDLEVRPGRASAMLRSNLIPDTANVYLPLDNGRAPGYRAFTAVMAGNTVIADAFIAEYPSGRYSKSHFHNSGAVLVCLRGKGYSFTWPKELGTRPWESGKGEEVKMQEYGPGGLISAAPGGDSWFHQHFAISKGPFRVFNFTGAATTTVTPGKGEGDLISGGPAEIGEGGHALPYYEEDPFIKEYYQRRLSEEGSEFTMSEDVYKVPKG